MCRAERFACCTHKISFQRFPWRKRERMKHQIHAIGLYPHAFEKCLDLIVVGNVAGKQRSFFSKLADQFLNVFLQSFALIIKNQARTRGRPCFCDRPRDAALVCHAEDNADFSCQNLLRHKSLNDTRISDIAKMPALARVVTPMITRFGVFCASLIWISSASILTAQEEPQKTRPPLTVVSPTTSAGPAVALSSSHPAAFSRRTTTAFLLSQFSISNRCSRLVQLRLRRLIRM